MIQESRVRTRNRGWRAPLRRRREGGHDGACPSRNGVVRGEDRVAGVGVPGRTAGVDARAPQRVRDGAFRSAAVHGRCAGSQPNRETLFRCVGGRWEPRHGGGLTFGESSPPGMAWVLESPAESFRATHRTPRPRHLINRNKRSLGDFRPASAVPWPSGVRRGRRRRQRGCSARPRPTGVLRRSP